MARAMNVDKRERAVKAMRRKVRRLAEKALAIAADLEKSFKDQGTSRAKRAHRIASQARTFAQFLLTEEYLACSSPSAESATAS